MNVSITTLTKYTLQHMVINNPVIITQKFPFMNTITTTTSLHPLQVAVMHPSTQCCIMTNV
jgi:hypothetical protein